MSFRQYSMQLALRPEDEFRYVWRIPPYFRAWPIIKEDVAFQNSCIAPEPPFGIGWTTPAGDFGTQEYTHGQPTTVSLLMDAGTPVDIATHTTNARPPAALPTDTGSSSWMMPPSNDVFTMSDVF
eukprot:4558358-Pyramimonas_sp.AAC.1